MVEVCAGCRYEYEEDYENGEKVVKKGDEEFMDIHTKEELFVTNKEPYTHGDYNYQIHKKAGLIACPKCYTVKLVIID